MQGVLLCLSDGSLGDPCPMLGHDIASLSLGGPLARCTFLSIGWGGQYVPASKDSVLLPVLHHLNCVDWRLHGKFAHLACGDDSAP